MLKRKLHTLYIALPKKVHKELFKVYKSLSNKYTNEYLDEKYWVTHISIGKLRTEEGKKASGELKNVKLQNKELLVNEFHVSVQTSDLNNQYSILKKFYL